jgi:hypothetical protein
MPPCDLLPTEVLQGAVPQAHIYSVYPTIIFEAHIEDTFSLFVE